MMNRNEAGHVKASISLAAIIGASLKLRRTGRIHEAPCPFHMDRTPSFYVYDDHYHCFGCGAHGDAFDWLHHQHGMTFQEAIDHLAGNSTRPMPTARRQAPPAVKDHGDEEERARKIELARRVWCESVDPRGTIVESYLRARGVILPDQPVIRFHPHCPRAGGALPAMICRMDDPRTGQPVGIHRTFLRSDGGGKAAVAKSKAMLGRAGTIRLASVEGEGIGLAEGVETSLSVIQTIGWSPVWAAGSRGGIQTFPVLPSHSLTVFADGDAPGLAAANACAARWIAAGREAVIHAAPPGKDWIDVTQGAAA